MLLLLGIGLLQVSELFKVSSPPGIQQADEAGAQADEGCQGRLQPVAAAASSGAHGFRGFLAVAGGLADLILCWHCQKGRW